MPKVSIIIPTLNRPEFLSEAIRSSLNQTIEDIEVIVVHNASDDSNTVVAVCKQFDDPRLKFFGHKERLDAAGSWSRVMMHASGEYAKILCDDDLLAPNYTEVALQAFKKYPDAVLFTAGWERHERPRLQQFVSSRELKLLWTPPELTMVLSYLHIAGGGLPTLTMFRLDNARRLKPIFDSATFLDACDSGCWIRLLQSSGLISCGSSLAIERIHLGQAQKKWTSEHYKNVSQPSHRDELKR